jgi:hypothetical protein
VVHGRAQLTIIALPAVRAAAGDHPAVLLLEAAERRPAGVLVRLRVGLVVSVRVPGTVVHRLALGAHVSVLRKRRLIEVAVANRGNVTERVDGSRLTLTVVQRGHTPVLLRPAPREFLPRSRGLVVFAYPRRIRGARASHGSSSGRRRVRPCGGTGCGSSRRRGGAQNVDCRRSAL